MTVIMICVFVFTIILGLIVVPLMLRGQEYREENFEYSLKKEKEFARKRFENEKKKATDVDYE